MNNEKINAVLGRMKEKGLDQFLVTDPLAIRFLTGIMIHPGERLYGLLLRTNGQHTIFLNYLYFVKDTGFEEVWFADMDDQIAILASHLNTETALGIDKTWPARFLLPLQERCPHMKTVWASDCIDDIRAVKNEQEIIYMKEASRINDAVMVKVKNFIKGGMSEKQVAEYIDEEFLKAGASGNSFPTIVCFGANAADMHHEPSENVFLTEGDCILIDMGCVWNGYCSDMTRTFYYQSISEGQRRIHELVQEAVAKAEAVIRPGVSFAEIDAQARKVINEAGYGDTWRIRLGHFIGQEDHEYGDVSPANPKVCEPGMIFSIEPGIYLVGETGVRIEDLVLVTEDGVELLNFVEKGIEILS